MSETDLFPDPTSEPPSKTGLPRWLWFVAVPLLLLTVLTAVGFGSMLFYLAKEGSWPGVNPVSGDPLPNRADRAAIVTLKDFPARPPASERRRESFNKLCWDDGTRELDYYLWDDGEHGFSLSSQIVQDTSIESAQGMMRASTSVEEEETRWVRNDELFVWGDESRCYVRIWEGETEPDGISFTGRRGTTVVEVDWNDALFEMVGVDEAKEFLSGLVERMAKHEIDCRGKR